MGCDIHIVLEKKHDGKWVGVHAFPYYESVNKGYMFAPAIDRNYHRFAALAGVRGEGPDAKGFPEDASELSRMLFDRWEDDGHSFSYLSVVEATKIFLETARSDAVSDFGKKYPEHFFFGVETEDGFDNFRIVFWFDN